MGKDSLIKSTTNKKPVAGKKDGAKRSPKVSDTTKKTTKPKPNVKPKKKPSSAPKTARTKITQEATGTSPRIPVKQPSGIGIEPKPLPADETSCAGKPASGDPMPPSEKKPADPPERMIYYGAAGFVLLVLMVVIASWLNTQHYYIKSREGAVSIWQGKFAPKGANHLISVPGLQMAEPIKDTYTAGEVFPIIYQYYLDKADMLLDVPGMPDFDGVKKYLSQSRAYATTPEMKTVIDGRIDAINLMVLLYKADVAAGKNSPEDLQAAMGYFREALTYRMDEMESERIRQKAEAVRIKLENLTSADAGTPGGEEDKKQHP